MASRKFMEEILSWQVTTLIYLARILAELMPRQAIYLTCRSPSSLKAGLLTNLIDLLLKPALVGDRNPISLCTSHHSQ